jgi:esterase/lipase superfamily enzyme
MLFITNRSPQGSFITEPGREFRFNLLDNTSSASVYYCSHDRFENKNTELGSDDFLDALDKAQPESILFYLHGFKNLPVDVFEAAQRVQNLCDTLSPFKIMVIALIWPCRGGKGIIQRYYDDKEAAKDSGSPFSRVIQRFVDWGRLRTSPCKSMNLLSHSMGNRVLCSTLNNWYQNSPDRRRLFDTTFMVAPDIESNALESHQSGEIICEVSRDVLVYHARDDMALKASKVANADPLPRLGSLGPAYLMRIPKNVTVIDCGKVNQPADSIFGHSYFRSLDDDATKPGLVIRHIIDCLSKGEIVQHPFE